MKLFLISVVLFAASLRQATSQDRIEDIGISRIGPKAIRVAVPEFKFATESAQTTDLARVFNETLWNDLDFSGNIELGSRSFYPLGAFSAPGQIKTEDWVKPGLEAQYVAYGELSLTVGNRFSAAVFLRDLAAGTDPIRTTFPGAANQDDVRIAAHRYADRILETLGFGKGIGQTQITFVSDRTGSKEIYVMDYDGRNQRKLTSIGTIAITPNFSRFDDRIAYTAWRGQPERARIEILSEAGGRQTFEQNTGATNQVPSWSPDGKFIVYASNRDGDSNTEIYWANADGKETKRLTNSRGIDTSPTINPATGRQIAFISNRSGSPELYTMDSDGTNIQRITDAEGDVQNPAYSPDGSMIAFAWQKPKEGGFQIFLYDFRMRKITQLTSSSGRSERPTWAPDGKHIAFYSNRSGTDQIYAMTLDAKKVWQLTNTGANEAPSWSGYPAR